MYNSSFKNKSKVYIISGNLKGRKLSFRNNINVRPTTNRIKETLFNWLSKYIQNAYCLDCFSGSGALGLEAISRNAQFVTFLEIEKQNILSLINNTKKLNISNLEIIHTNTLNWLKKPRKSYDIIFIDPPYHKKLIEKTITLLEQNKWIKNQSIIYIETTKDQNFSISDHFTLYKKKITSRISCYLYIFTIKN
ncbi:16S rRNA (guanine(966)-N(2))-methyltransferase RsmD [Buchnera aphidicola]|uniref:Ribosomal RNA small subunit methyltransferase D n=1 Tax=Buchnera aphidicola (Aphis aurantii) TaxID=1470492 RepID=A0AAU6W4T8_9GAMM